MRLLPLVAAATAAFLVVACSSPTPPRGVIGNTAMRWFAARTATTCGYSPARQPFLTK